MITMPPFCAVADEQKGRVLRCQVCRRRAVYLPRQRDIVSRCVGFRHADHFPLLVDAGGRVIVTGPDVASTSANSPVVIDDDALSTRMDICLGSGLLLE